MTREEKSLLLRDICGRLPYGIKCTTKLTGYNDVYVVQGVYEDNVFIDCPVYEEGDNMWMIESIIPLLRPMSSMTDEEREEYRKFSYYGAAGYRNNDYKEMVATPSFEKMDFLNAHHFDYRGLIEKGLALEAPENC